jgi:hypothetical protein
MISKSDREMTTNTHESAVPWYVWCAVVAVTSAMVGTHWDIAWHRSIGRDSFWTPAHMAIYLAGVLAGSSCGYLILSTTFSGAAAARQAAVKIWGFRGPLGAFICAWGGVAMIASAPFDDWWHGAYGLDVKVLSPPHVVLIAGIIAIELGALILILGNMNRAQGDARRRLNWIFLYVAAMILVCLFILIFEYNFRLYMHGGRFYRVVSMVVPIVLAGASRASGRRWAATIVMSFYSVFLLLMLWILPLAPAETKLGPVYRQVTTLVPAEFPLLLIVPAILLDLLWARTANWNKWLQSLVAGVVFVAVFVAVQWPFATFLNSPAARNRFFGAIYFDYNLHPSSSYVRYLFFATEPSAAEFRIEMGLAVIFAIVTTRIGIAWGDWMQRIRR